MVFPLVPLALGVMGASALTGAGANWYSQSKQRELYNYQRGGYVRQFRDWQKNVPGRAIKYPEFSYPGHIRALDTGISQSYAAALGTGARLTGQLAGGALYTRPRSGRSLFSQSVGRTSRFL